MYSKFYQNTKGLCVDMWMNCTMCMHARARVCVCVCVCVSVCACMSVHIHVCTKSECRQHIVPSFSSVSALMLCISSTTSRMSCNSSREKCSRRSGWYTWHRGGVGAMDTGWTKGGHAIEVYTSKVHIHMCKSRQ